MGDSEGSQRALRWTQTLLMRISRALMYDSEDTMWDSESKRGHSEGTKGHYTKRFIEQKGGFI